MRYKFRAWHEGYPAGVDPQMLYDSTPGDCLKWKAEGQKIAAIMQWTGLTDRNGKEVYEGDVLSNGQHINWVVIFEDASFKVKFPEPINTQRFVLDRWMAESREIVGNIYENSELINS